MCVIELFARAEGFFRFAQNPLKKQKEIVEQVKALYEKING